MLGPKRGCLSIGLTLKRFVSGFCSFGLRHSNERESVMLQKKNKVRKTLGRFILDMGKVIVRFNDHTSNQEEA